MMGIIHFGFENDVMCLQIRLRLVCVRLLYSRERCYCLFV